MKLLLVHITTNTVSSGRVVTFDSTMDIVQREIGSQLAQALVAIAGAISSGEQSRDPPHPHTPQQSPQSGPSRPGLPARVDQANM